MKRALPSELSRLLDGAGSDGGEDAWPVFLSKYSRLILRTARSMATDHDRAMDAYGYPEHIRVNVGLPEENQRFLATLKQVLGL